MIILLSWKAKWSDYQRKSLRWTLELNLALQFLIIWEVQRISIKHTYTQTQVLSAAYHSKGLMDMKPIRISSNLSQRSSGSIITIYRWNGDPTKTRSWIPILPVSCSLQDFILSISFLQKAYTHSPIVCFFVSIYWLASKQNKTKTSFCLEEQCHVEHLQPLPSPFWYGVMEKISWEVAFGFSKWDGKKWLLPEVSCPL